MSDWVAVEDPTSGKTYYANMKTRETSWDPPAGFGAPQSSAKESAAPISGNSNGDYWECEECTFVNHIKNATCKICSNPQPQQLTEKQIIENELMSLGFEQNYIKRAFKVYEVKFELVSIQ